MAETSTTKIVRLEVEMKNVVNEIAEVKSLVKEVIVKVEALSNLRVEIDNLKIEVTELKKTASELAKANASTAIELRAELATKEKKDALTGNIQKLVIAGFTALFTFLLIAYLTKGQ